MKNNVQVMQSKIVLGKGATFWGYISPSKDSSKWVTEWRIELQHKDSGWLGVITSKDPYYQPQSPGLGGEFLVRVTASGPKFPTRQLKALPESMENVYCKADCAAMVGIVAMEDGASAGYWTVSNAFCEDAGEQNHQT